MDIAFSHILHHKILKDLKKNNEIPFTDISLNKKDTYLKKVKDCPLCGQSIYFCVCSINNSLIHNFPSKSYKDYSSK